MRDIREQVAELSTVLHAGQVIGGADAMAGERRVCLAKRLVSTGELIPARLQTGHAQGVPRGLGAVDLRRHEGLRPQLHPARPVVIQPLHQEPGGLGRERRARCREDVLHLLPHRRIRIPLSADSIPAHRWSRWCSMRPQTPSPTVATASTAATAIISAADDGRVRTQRGEQRPHVRVALCRRLGERLLEDPESTGHLHARRERRQPGSDCGDLQRRASPR